MSKEQNKEQNKGLNGLLVPLYEAPERLKDLVAHNMKLWAAVWRTDPRITKSFNKRGFSGSAIDPQQQRKLATAMFGPKGLGWGVKDATFTFSGEQYGQHCLYQGTFWFKVPQSEDWGEWAGRAGEFAVSASMQLWQQRRATKEWFFKEDYAKILQTDGMTKALSELGFNADVFEGRFDDNKYVLSMEEYFTNAYPGITDSRKPEDKAKTAAERKKQQSAKPPAQRPASAAKKKFAYSGKNVTRARQLFEKEDADAVLVRLTQKLGYIVEPIEEQKLRDDYANWLAKKDSDK